MFTFGLRHLSSDISGREMFVAIAKANKGNENNLAKMFVRHSFERRAVSVLGARQLRGVCALE